ncbi:glial fibrillary acidic protein-like [Cucumis melo var. makuwa]|uniref:Glial fibrillary acidic protein-like n=1 Tax=Cucumis melo var. makuwa TaxID=1194695 RepID=A0A5A7T064_CUCMM|nr:glial fibrillary acidic protein-like [Cucumis melo var. makuwa]
MQFLGHVRLEEVVWRALWTWLKQFAPVMYGLEDWNFLNEADETVVKVQKAVEAWKVVRRMKSLRHCEEEQCKNALLRKAVASSEHQLLICRNAQEVVTEDHARLKNEHKEVSVFNASYSPPTRHRTHTTGNRELSRFLGATWKTGMARLRLWKRLG